MNVPAGWVPEPHPVFAAGVEFSNLDLGDSMVAWIHPIPRANSSYPYPSAGPAVKDALRDVAG